MRTLYVFLILLSCFSAFGQVEKQVNPPKGDLPRQIPPDSSRLAVDTVVNKRDTLTSRADSLRARRRKSDIETTIVYSARDSLNSSMDKKIVHLYGDAKIKYGTVELMAEEITIDYENSTITANGKLDSLGKRVGYPVFVNGSEKYETKDIVYNFKSKKAKISEIVTKQGDAVLHGSAVYKNEKNELFSIRNGYTTCNLRHPHYQIMASRAKSIPGDKTVVGPFHMIFNDVPLPLGFAFGMFPAPRKSKSGVIVPAYGEERRRGFFLRNGGWFFDINDYVKVALTGDVYTRGSSAVYLNSTYTKRYKYSGSFNFSFTNNRATDNIEDRNTTKDFRLAWNHSPQSRGTGRFSASVNAATATFNNNNFLGINTNPNANRIDNTSRKLSSNVSYSKTFGKNLSLGINLRHNQDITTKQVDLPLPDVSFNVNNLYPFKKISKSMVLENLSVRYTMTGTNQITNNLGRIKPKDPNTDSIATFNLQNLPIFLRNSRRGIRHQIPIATSFKALKFFTFSPSLSYDERWYFERYVWSNPVGGVYAKPDTLRGFNRISNYSASLGVNTRIYGTYFFKRKNGIQAIRHIVNPSASISYQPDFSKEQYGYYQKLTDQKTGQTVFKSVHDGFVYGSSGIGESA
ncbi:MAG: LPS-assembly protein LptD, partial [Cyclobacteriaceae bacterium]|nr:LPS-assembly protein LptD [Cyclobacteriaceae bacterium]